MLLHRITILLGSVILTLVAQPSSPGGPAPVMAALQQAATCDQAPTKPATRQVSDLDQFVDDWGVFCEASPVNNGFPTWQKQEIAAPALDGQALQCSITGGAPYANIHCYRNLLSEPATVGITFTLAFQFWPEPSCTDLQTACVQALEFSVSKWQSRLR